MDYGYFVRPPEETGTGRHRVEPVLGYLIQHRDGLILVDTGMGYHPDVDDHYHPRRRALHEAVAKAGGHLDEVRFVVNCHLHFDHCGGNPELAGRTIIAQRIELETARTQEHYTLPELVDGPGLVYELLDGEAEILPGVLVIPTPGHTDGHQSLVVRHPDGTVIVAGQSHDTATDYGSDVLAWQAATDSREAEAQESHDGQDATIPPTPAWIDRLQAFDPRRVVFAHDRSVWEP